MPGFKDTFKLWQVIRNLNDIFDGGTTGQALSKASDDEFDLEWASGSGDVTKVGTPVNNEVGVWTGDGTLEGNTNFTWNGVAVSVGGNIIVTGTVDGVNIGDNYANWNTAFGWGDHASGGYLTTVIASNVNAEASADGYVLTSDGAGNAAWEAGGGGVTASGSPLNNEVAVFSSGTDINSDSTFTWNGTTLEATQFAGIAKADLLDKSATETVSGAWTFSGDVVLNDTVSASNTTGVATLSYNGTSVLQTQDHTASDNLTGVEIKHTNGTMYPAGLAVAPIVSITQTSGTYTVTENDWHMMLRSTATSGGHTINLPNMSDVPNGALLNIMRTGDGTCTITASTTLRWFNGDGTSNTGSRSLEKYGWITVWKYTDSAYYIAGTGLS